MKWGVAPLIVFDVEKNLKPEQVRSIDRATSRAAQQERDIWERTTRQSRNKQMTSRNPEKYAWSEGGMIF